MADERADSGVETGLGVPAGSGTPVDGGDGVDREALAGLLERYRLPPLRSAEPIPGTSQDTLLVNGEMVVRIDRGDYRPAQLAKQAMIYRRLRHSTDVPGPEILGLDLAHDLVPYDVLIRSHVEGESGNAVWPTLDEDAREQLSEEVGRMFGAIHGLQWSGYGEYDPATGLLGHDARWNDMLLHRVERVVAEAQAHAVLPQPLIDGVLTELNDGDSVLETASPPALVHGDLGMGNLLLKKQSSSWHVAAILHWQDAFAADAAWEFAALAFRRSGDDPIGDGLLYGYRERHPVQADLRSRIHLYRLILHLEGAVMAQRRAPTKQELRRPHEYVLRRMLQKK